jgi:hypothetical protein
MAEKYIYNNQGTLTEKEATVVSTGSGDAGKIVALDATGRLDNSLLPVGVGADTKVLPASENLVAGDFVNIWNDSGTVKVRKADATTAGKEANGFVLSAVSAGSNATVYFEGTNNQLSGLTGGAMYFLSTTAGGVTSTPPSGAGNIVQKIGRALSATEINVEFSDPIVLA